MAGRHLADPARHGRTRLAGTAHVLDTSRTMAPTVLVEDPHGS
ncbi:hypothetical protein [Streptomyces sp. NPDC048737]